MGMGERCKNLAFGAEPLQDGGGVHPAADELHSDRLEILAIGADGLVDGAHAAMAEFADEEIGPHAEADIGGGIEVVNGVLDDGFELSPGVGIVGEKGFDGGA